jgi:hypothetical protein
VNCSAENGTLNPNNPFAAAGQTAELHYMLAGALPDTITFRAAPIAGGGDCRYLRQGLGLHARFHGHAALI